MMRTLDEALGAVLDSFIPLEPETVGLDAALGRVLAEPFVARRDQPAFDNSAMDGWALCATGTDETRVVAPGESAAGGPRPAPLASGTALRIFTGAPLPPGADTVVLQEDAVLAGDRVRFTEAPTPGQHVRRRASEFTAGDELLPAGAAIHAGTVALLASQGVRELVVGRRPRVAVVPTGDELRAPGSDAPEGSLYDSNGPMLAAAITAAGGEPVRHRAVGDDRSALAAAFARALEDADLLLTTGGVSVGDHDHVKEALADAGVPLDLWKVAMKPGKPLAFGRSPEGKAVLGLPGNPVSAFVTFQLFGRPAIRRLLGDPRPALPRIHARLTAPLAHRPGRTELARVRVERTTDAWVAHPHAQQGSGALLAMAQANALAVVPAESSGIDGGAVVECLLFGDLPGEPHARHLDT